MLLQGPLGFGQALEESRAPTRVVPPIDQAQEANVLASWARWLSEVHLPNGNRERTDAQQAQAQTEHSAWSPWGHDHRSWLTDMFAGNSFISFAAAARSDGQAHPGGPSPATPRPPVQARHIAGSPEALAFTTLPSWAQGKLRAFVLVLSLIFVAQSSRSVRNNLCFARRSRQTCPPISSTVS